MRNAVRPLYLCVLGFRAVTKLSYPPQKPYADNRTDAFDEGTQIKIG